MSSKRATGPASKRLKGRIPVAKSSTDSRTNGSTTTRSVAPAGAKGKKRKVIDDDDKEIVKDVKRSRASSSHEVSAPTAGAVGRKVKSKVAINKAPTNCLDVYVFGAGEMGELGLGRAPGQQKVKRPRLNPLLTAAGVVSLSVGGMHTAALTSGNKILTWGVNDDGALGRNTDEEADDDLDSDTGLNFKESTPDQVDTSGLPADIVWTGLACTDSATFALTDNGQVYGWGCFRGNEGNIGFDPQRKKQDRPVQIAGLRNIIQLAAGANHVLALSGKGEVFAWGAGQQSQLGRRIIERRKTNSLVPMRVGLPRKIVLIGAGAYHSFAVTESGQLYSWGLNSFGEAGIALQIGDGGESVVHQPTIVESLHNFGKIICINGGSHHTVAVTDRGELLVWGRLDGFQLGLELSSLTEDDVIRDSAGHARILKNPAQIAGVDAAFASAGSDHCVAVARNGKAYAWGFSENYQTGLGSNKDVQVATQIDGDDHPATSGSKEPLNGKDDSDTSDDEDSRPPTANAKTGSDGIGGKKMVWAGCAAQFSILAALPATPKTTKATGVNGKA